MASDGNVKTLRERAVLVRGFVRENGGVHEPRRRSVVDVMLGVWFLAVLPRAAHAGIVWGTGFAALAALLLLPRVRELLRPLWRAAPATMAVLRAWYPFVLVPLLYTSIPSLHGVTDPARFHDPAILDLERALFGAVPPRVLADAAPWLWVSEPLHFAYLSYYFLAWSPALWFYLRERMRGFDAAATSFVFTSLVCFLVFVYYPVQGPRYLFPAPTAGDIELGFLYGLTHRILEAGSSQGAAFPSGHVAVAVGQALIVWAWAGWQRGLAVTVLAVALALGAVYGGYHYGVDALAGAVVGAASLGVAYRFAQSKV